jgi:glycosyltransferase involved in cell wall biosynthesis
MARILVTAHDQLVLPLYLPQFSFIIGTSRVYAETSPILSARKDRVVVIPNGVDTERFTPKARGDVVRSRLGLGGGRVVLFVGALTRWHRYKGLDVLMKAMAIIKNETPETRLLVVGGGELEAEYRQLAHQLGVADSTVFAGNMPDEELPMCYACSDVLVLPSKDRSEGFGLTILEANATGKPAIGTTVGGIPSVIRDRYNGLLVPPNDPSALADAIRRTISDDDLLKQMGKNGRVFAEQHDWSVVAARTEDLYKRALTTQ